VNSRVKLIEAFRPCWASVDSDRPPAYLGERGRDPAAVAMAVIVHRAAPFPVPLTSRGL
jgi:hypothetical protein